MCGRYLHCAVVKEYVPHPGWRPDGAGRGKKHALLYIGSCALHRAYLHFTPSALFESPGLKQALGESDKPVVFNFSSVQFPSP